MIIEGNSVAECWLKILNELVVAKKNEISPLIVKINITDDIPSYQYELENDLNEFLRKIDLPCIETTAGTIFPVSLSSGNKSIFERYERNWKYIKTNSKNRRGTYFRRLTAYGEGYGRRKNQLKQIIDTYNGIGERKPVHRRSALIATTFDPTLDHISSPLLGFPCLQQVCFIPSGDNLSMNAIYAMQYLLTRAYGNYLGLIRLGQFMAKEMGLEFVQLNCVISVLGFGDSKIKKSAKELIMKYT
jgi:thymidylate synthase